MSLKDSMESGLFYQECSQMRIRMISPLFSIGAALMMALVVNAQEPAVELDAGDDVAGIEELLGTEGGVPERLRDAGFSSYVDLELLGQALNDQDAAALCDVGLQLIDGERALLRAHK